MSTEETALLLRIAQDGEADARQQAQVLLLWGQGLTADEIAANLNVPVEQVHQSIQIYTQQGKDIFPTTLVDRFEEAIASDEIERKDSTASRKLRTPGVLADDPMSEAGRKVLRFHFERMLMHEPGTRLGEDIEALHDMRVATRRMRAAFRIFGSFFKPQLINPFLKGLRRTGRALGQVRDLDVFMEKANHYLEKSAEEDQGALDPLLETWRQQRQAMREEMLRYLDGRRYKQFVADFGEFLATEGAGAKRVKSLRPVAYKVYQVAPTLLYKRYGVIRGYDTVLVEAQLETLHALRIDVKRFRYLLEFLQEALGRKAKDVIRECVTVQDHLGDLNDSDVACQMLIDFLEAWRVEEQRERIEINGVTRYLVSKQSELRFLVDTFPKTWERFTQSKVRRNLALAISEL